MPAIFIVDDDPAILDSLEIFFTGKDYRVQTFRNGNNLLGQVRDNKPDIVLLDVNLNGENGRYICQDIKMNASYPVKVLLFSANPAALLSYEYDYADGIINKPFQLSDLERKCANLLLKKRTWLD